MRHSRCVVYMHYLMRPGVHASQQVLMWPGVHASQQVCSAHALSYAARCKVHECKRCLLQCPRRIWVMGVRRDFGEERVQGGGGGGGCENIPEALWLHHLHSC